MIERLTLAEWQAFDALHPAPTFFARPAWAMALSETEPGTAPVLLRIRSGRDRAVLLPVLCEQRSALSLRHLTAFPLGGYSCFMYEDGTMADAESAQRAIREALRYAHSIAITPWPLGPGLAGRPSAVHETGVIDLSNGLDAALAGVDGCYRRMAGQAERRGVTCAVSREPGAAQTYYELLCESAKRWGIPEPVRRKALIEALVRYGGEDVEIWFAHAEGKAIAGGIVFYGSSEFFFWSAAMLAEYGRLRPSNALNFALLRAAASRGMHWYNLGSSEGLPGVARFKRDLGAQDVRYNEYAFARTPLNVYRTVRRTLARA